MVLFPQLCKGVFLKPSKAYLTVEVVLSISSSQPIAADVETCSRPTELSLLHLGDLLEGT